MRGRWSVALVLVLAGMPVPSAPAHPAYRKALAEYFGPSFASKLNNCRTCHVARGDDEDEVQGRAHNVFGARVKSIKYKLREEGKRSTIPMRLEAIGDEDSDGDGAANLIELITGHFPGASDDTPSADEIARGKTSLDALKKARSPATTWAPFEPVHRPVVPEARESGWVLNPIDAFLAAEREARGLSHRPDAPKAVLLRRVTLDLTGLPPTPEELHAFLNDPSPDAYEKVVDRLLSSPRHGERWGRHWMDVWRYSDWAGYGPQIRDSQPHIWRWRDWIVESLNQDKGYDRMVVEMLAADELSPDDPDALRATGYLVRNYKLLSREKWMQDVVDHTGQAFLGVTLGCARCHDHMYDPIRQKEYYQVRAIFEPHQVRIDRIPGAPNPAKDGLARAYDADPAVKTFLFLRGDDRTPAREPLAPPGVPESLGGTFAVRPVSLPRGAVAPDRRAFVLADDRAASEATVIKAREALDQADRALAKWYGPPFLAIIRSDKDLKAVRLALKTQTMARADLALIEAKHAAFLAVLDAETFEEMGRADSPEGREAATAAAQAQRLFRLQEARWQVAVAEQYRIDAAPSGRAKADKDHAGALKKLALAEAEASSSPTTAYTKRPAKTYPAESTGRRLAFARWVVDRDNPLAARVAVNHVWLRHFGQAIVPTVADFGKNGRRPTHPALLDWLATEFMDRGWSLKTLHRLIVTSQTYRQSSTPDPVGLRLDPDNAFLWRFSPRRLEAEAVRDSLFAVAGTLDLTLGGPEIDQNAGLTTPRRSLYFRHAAEKQMEFLRIFDCASVTESYQRTESILPQQALALANSELTFTQARLLARRLAAEVGPDPFAFTSAAFERVLSRPPTSDELAECLAYLKQQAPGSTSAAPDPALRARESLVHVLMNHHEFVTLR